MLERYTAERATMIVRIPEALCKLNSVVLGSDDLLDFAAPAESNSSPDTTTRARLAVNFGVQGVSVTGGGDGQRWRGGGT